MKHIKLPTMSFKMLPLIQFSQPMQEHAICKVKTFAKLQGFNSTTITLNDSLTYLETFKPPILSDSLL